MIIIHDPLKITHPYFNDPSNRWLTGLTNEQHHSLPAISSSAVKYFHKKSPWAFYKKYVLRESTPQENKPEFKMGTLIHLAILEPETFEKCVFVCDEIASTNKYKEFRQKILNNFGKPKEELLINSHENVQMVQQTLDEKPNVYKEAAQLAEQISIAKKERVKRNSKKKITEEVIIEEHTELISRIVIDQKFIEDRTDVEVIHSKNGGYIVGKEEIYFVKSHEMRMLREIQKNVNNHARLSLMLPNCQYIEQSGIAQCPKTGLFLSCRGDARSDLGYFIDPKSAADLSMHSMESSQASFTYFLQHAHYLYVANLIEPGKYDRFYFLYVSKESPHEVCLTHLNDEDVEKANNLYFNILNRIAECEYKQKWPTLDNGNGLLLKIPRWAFS